MPMFAFAATSPEESQPSSMPSSWSNTDMSHLIARIGWAAQQQDFSGQYIISQADQLIALHTTHIFTGQSEYELVTTMTGEKHQIFRKDDAYYSVDVHTKRVIFDRQPITQSFPFWGKPGYGHANQCYKLSMLCTERFMDRDTDVIRVTPQDDKRFGYKVWLDQETGLLLRLEVEEKEGVALQRFTFTKIEFQPPTETQKKELSHYIEALKTQNYKIQEWPFVYISAQEQGWQLSEPPQGFEPITCVLRPLHDESQRLLQWVFSDGVATVSIFIEPRAPGDNSKSESLPRNGATHGIVYMLGQWKVTLVGEVPEKTLQEFASALKRTPAQIQ
ncbi:MAG: MucB/RseB C-terminal domain-containing protein [Saezia sp.]